MLKQVTDQACIWMRAGLIRFWLCDRAFDCDGCPLDRALRVHRSSTRPSRPSSATPAADACADPSSGSAAD